MMQYYTRYYYDIKCLTKLYDNIIMLTDIDSEILIPGGDSEKCIKHNVVVFKMYVCGGCNKICESRRVICNVSKGKKIRNSSVYV